MLMESFVAIMALLSAAVMEPGTYFAINAPAAALGASAESAAEAIRGWGFAFDPTPSSVSRARSASTRCSRARAARPRSPSAWRRSSRKRSAAPAVKALWYHFAIMFEALFILTTLDAGTRVGRFLMQDFLGQLHPALGRTGSLPANVLASGLIVAGWGYFLYQGVVDPLGGINSLWPLFGIANQLLATTALALGTTILVKSRRPQFAIATAIPLVWLLSVTMTAGWQKILDPDPRIGFWTLADHSRESSPRAPSRPSRWRRRRR